MLKNNKIIYLIGFLYSTIATSIYFRYFYREDVSIILIFIIPFILFLPILLSLDRARVRLYFLEDKKMG